MAQIMIEVDEDLKHKFMLKVVENKTTQKDVITKMIEEYIKEEQND